MRALEHNLRLGALILAMLCACFAPGQNLVLRTSVDVTTETVHLCDLLPRGASDDLRRLAQEIDLGRAPMLGSMRVYQGSWLSQILWQHPEISKQITVPDQIVVKRAGFPISRTTVHDVVARYLQERGQANLPDSALQWSGGISTTTAHPALDVRAANWDSRMRQLRFRLRCVPDETCRDFLVSLQNPPETLAQEMQKLGWGNNRATKTTDASQNSADGPVLIERGRRVRLLMHGDGIEITTSVICLERGRAGQKIRVRAAGGRRVFQAEVVNRELLWSRPES
jgi:hypothetical protein